MSILRLDESDRQTKNGVSVRGMERSRRAGGGEMVLPGRLSPPLPLGKQADIDGVDAGLSHPFNFDRDGARIARASLP